MPAPPGSGALSTVVDTAVATLAASGNWTGTNYKGSLPEPHDGEAFTKQELVGYRPYSLTYTNPQNGFTRLSQARSSSGLEFRGQGSIIIEIEENVGPLYSE